MRVGDEPAFFCPRRSGGVLANDEMNLPTIDSELQAELAAVAAEAGCELLHVEFKAGVLRLVLDRPEGVGLGHCEAVSRQASALLDVRDFAAGGYTLEVSSPGLDRELYGPPDYQRFVGQPVRATWHGAADGRKRTIIGRLAAFRAEGVPALEVEESETGAWHEIPLDRLLKVRLEPQF